ncbi:MAG: peptide chain release factor 2 [Candidatus Peribacter sp.]|nr:peptide chain release factor 2 [Candidatus Peribacter sp.]MBT4393259.1 peptide chain release factor 2 [Candidatus Peribacter sp.]MBT4601154.1 peptide chain release factor 2 [Candidatus Peribacter sp.]MBT5148886.1 peptide chain release factor 2 [Candidatus Peribacter sp.]MBT5637234.1 peptide chain release factor 2 [Candidatus Peribacter sp.]
MPKLIEELEKQSQDPNLWDDQSSANALFAKLKSLKKQWEPVSTLLSETDGLLEMIEASTAEDLPALEEEFVALENTWKEVEIGLYLSGEFDMNNAYITLSGGAGGTDAQDWAAMLMRMYLRYCERQGWEATLVEKTDGQEVGIKSATIHIQGEFAFGFLQCERGTHRLVRLSPFNAKNLRQTSFALVEVLPEITETTEIELEEKDLRIDTFRASGAGGQHVNKTDSAVRITHEPTGLAVACQSERSQQQNRIRAMNMLRAMLLEKKRSEDAEQKEGLKGASKSADFGQQIRSYVLHPYQMVKDLRTNIETGNTDAVLDGDIQQFIDAELKRSK